MVQTFGIMARHTAEQELKGENCSRALLKRNVALHNYNSQTIAEAVEREQPPQGTITTFDAFKTATINQIKGEPGNNGSAQLLVENKKPLTKTETFVTYVLNRQTTAKAKHIKGGGGLADSIKKKPKMPDIFRESTLRSNRCVSRWRGD